MSNDSDIHEMGRASVKYIPLHEKYEATAPSDDVSGASKKGKVPERSDSDTRWKNLVDETKNSKRRRLISTKMLEAFENGSVVFGLASARESRKKIDKKDAGDVYWPLDENWYYGHISGYNPITDRHQVKYNDGDEEHLVLSNERISFHVSPEEMQQLNLSCVRHPDVDDMPRGYDMGKGYRASFGACNSISSGSILWYPDFARLSKKHIIPFLKGLLYELHRKCKR
ncbi:hypothetical protein POM88_002152 [Heracleum sosnowskyi]|uniref:Uncharacterized protein n=1 Tax=Heracleum sosnowskyi TaxID=360622 RepID=A0AAD8JDV3_9APIA|nr:hypothetical protein POM88_002152 [Heracleum sosnowskyi]